ncbi:hypothetical protein [Maribellus sediminis]|uniref:hypothetical protein n=1 Tax=Maribellus sediminis TaxID=2696285 RepID=UPI0014300C9F|nr:hypothetical protein [Maribellus sediminis]
MEALKSTEINRKNFLRKACWAGACICGFMPVAGGGTNERDSVDEESVNTDLKLMQDWISNLLLSLGENLTEDDCRKVLKTSAMAHYDFLTMEKVLAPYIGDLLSFNAFISKEWGWMVDYNPDTGVLIANENKPHCVCPLLNQKQANKYPALCYCSEGFAEKMFSEVIGYPVTARVLTSVQRGDNHCVYEVKTRMH